MDIEAHLNRIEAERAETETYDEADGEALQSVEADAVRRRSEGHPDHGFAGELRQEVLHVLTTNYLISW